jgi:putative transcriptional regulator
MVKNRLKEIRHNLYIDTQIEMAKLLGITQAMYNRYECQAVQPNLETALRMAKLLKIPVEKIFYID